MKTDVILLGGFHEIIELCDECNLNIVGIIDNKLTGTYYDVPVIGTDDDAKKLFPEYKTCKIVVVPDSPQIREKLVSVYKYIGYNFATVISPLAHISKFVEIGEGTVIQSGVNVSSATKIGCFCKLNTNSNVMHDNQIGDFTTIAPNAVSLGGVETGRCVYIGANATVLPQIYIGENAVVGAGAVVTHNVAKCTTVKGVPAK